ERSAHSRQLTIDRFQSWAADIRSHAMSFQDGTHFTIGEYFSSSLESLFQDFEIAFFHLS
ncbi:MAG: hypothetical protein ACYDBJ_17635, partial [Aggregatilineales bacterium]